MVQAKIEDSKLILEVEGWDKLWALKSHLEIPLVHVAYVKIDRQALSHVMKGIKIAGSRVPGVIKAGTFFEHEGRVFWDVHDPQKAILIGLKDEKYKELVVEVKDPESTVEMIRQSLNNLNG